MMLKYGYKCSRQGILDKLKFEQISRAEKFLRTIGFTKKGETWVGRDTGYTVQIVEIKQERKKYERKNSVRKKGQAKHRTDHHRV